MSQPRFHPAARREYVDALLYYEDRRVGYGARFEAEVQSVLERVRQFPASGPRMGGLPPEIEARSFPLRTFRYSLMVVFEEGQPVIYAVAHQQRKPGY